MLTLQFVTIALLILLIFLLALIIGFVFIVMRLFSYHGEE